MWSAELNHPGVASPDQYWDGTADDGSVAPAGSYIIKVLEHACTYAWDGVIGNTSIDHTTQTYHMHHCPIFTMEITAAGEMYFATGYSERTPSASFTTTAAPQVTSHAVPVEFRNTYGPSYACCTDGTIAYWAIVDGTVTGIWGSSCATKTKVSFASGVVYDQFSLIGKTIGASAFDNYIRGLAVQKAGSILIGVRPQDGDIITLDKTSGALLQTNTSYVEPHDVAVNAVDDHIWILYSIDAGVTHSKVSEFTADGAGNLTETGVHITGLSDGQAISVSPDGTMILVADGGSSQQVKCFNTSDGSSKAAWGSTGALGSAGGYATSPTVTNTKFMFTSFALFGGREAYLAHAPDGSFWLGDTGNFRNLHFSSGNSPTYIEQIAYIPSFYANWVCYNNETRVFADFLEFEIDYSKPLSPTNGSWTLKNNWHQFFFGQGNVDQYNRMLFTAELSNGRTYGMVVIGFDRRIFELASTGLRDTGIVVDPTIYFAPDWNIWFVEQAAPTQVSHIRRNLHTGFDGSNNPLWEAPTNNWPPVINRVLTLETLPTGFTWVGSNDATLNNPVLPTRNGVYPFYDANSFHESTHHLGGFSTTTGNIVFDCHPSSTPTPNQGASDLRFLVVPDNPHFPIGGGVGANGGGTLLWYSGQSDIFSTYDGETWGNNQTNLIYHWHDSGLLVDRFGVAAPYFGAFSLTDPSALEVDGPNLINSFKGLEGMAGNARWSRLGRVNGKYYLYQNDEWYHSGLHRWTIDNTSTIKITSFSVTHDGASHPLTADSTDLLDGLPYNTIDIASGTAGWVRSDADIGGNHTIAPYLAIYTSAVISNTRRVPYRAPDLAMEAKSATDYTVYHPVTNVGGGNWSIDAVAIADLCSFDSGIPGDVPNGVSFDILDGTGKRILRMYNEQDVAQIASQRCVLMVNDTPITGRASASEWQYRCGQLVHFTVTANVSGAQLTVSWGGFSVSVSVDEVGANISSPAKLQLTYRGVPASGGAARWCFSKLNISGAVPA